MECKHKDGWVITDGVFSENSDDNIEVEVICNTRDCEQTKKFRISVVDIEELR